MPVDKFWRHHTIAVGGGVKRVKRSVDDSTNLKEAIDSRFGKGTELREDVLPGQENIEASKRIKSKGLSVGRLRISHVGNPEFPTDAANKWYVGQFMKINNNEIHLQKRAKISEYVIPPADDDVVNVKQIKRLIDNEKLFTVNKTRKRVAAIEIGREKCRLGHVAPATNIHDVVTAGQVRDITMYFPVYLYSPSIDFPLEYTVNLTGLKLISVTPESETRINTVKWNKRPRDMNQNDHITISATMFPCASTLLFTYNNFE